MSEREMDGFERELTKALRRVDAPQGFADRVMERAAADPTHDDETVMNGASGYVEPGDRTSHVSEARRGAHRLLVMRGPRAWVGGAIAAVLVLGAFGAEQVHVRREREQATQQFEVASRITDQALRQTREQLARAGVSLE